MRQTAETGFSKTQHNWGSRHQTAKGSNFVTSDMLEEHMRINTTSCCAFLEQLGVGD